MAPSDSIIETTEGAMTYRQWLEGVEIPRIRGRTDWPVGIYTNPQTGEIALAHFKSSKPRR